RASGLEVTRVEIMHLDPECAHPDLDRLFVREDVTDAVTEMLPDITAALAAQKRVLEGPRPEVAIGPHCTSPHRCPFMRRCWAGIPPHHVTSLYRAGALGFELMAAGYRMVGEIDRVPEGVELDPAALRQSRSARTVVAYHADFEADVIEHLESAVPERAAELAELRGRLRDPLPILRAYVYHPGFAGRFGLKWVAPVLAPDVRYDGAVAAGGA